MKKWIVRIAVVVVLLLVIVVFVSAMFLGSIIKNGVETVGPMITKTEMKLDRASVSLFSGSGSIKGFILGNPEGFKAPQAISVGKVDLGVKPMSVLSDKVQITHIRMEAPDITFESQGVNIMANNLSKILDNVQAVAGGADTSKDKTKPKEAGSSKKIQVDDFLISGAKVHVSSTVVGGQSVVVPLPDIHLQNIGTGSDGVTAAELTDRIFKELVPVVVKAAEQAIGNKATKGVGDLFKKK